LLKVFPVQKHIPDIILVLNCEGHHGRDRMVVYNYLCNQCLSPLTLWVLIPLRRGVLNATLYNKVCQWLAAGRWFSPGTLGFLHQ